MAASEEKIRELLGNGLSNEVVANAVGVTPSYVSQLMSREDFHAEVVALRTRTLTAATSRDRSWDTLEDKLMDKLTDLVESGMGFYKPNELLRALAVANKAVRRGNSPTDSFVVNKTIVNLTLPTVVVQHYKKNSQGEVIEVTNQDGNTQTLTTMPAAALMQSLVESHQGNKDYEQLRKYLPQSAEDSS